MGEADAEVNLVAGDGGEADSDYENEYDYQYECEYEGLWVGTLGATGVPEKSDESADTTAGRESAQCDDSAKEGEEIDQHECEYESLWVGTIGATEMPEKADKPADITAGRGPVQDDDPVEMEEEVTGDEQWDLEAGQSDGRADGARDPLHGSSPRPPGDRTRPPRPTESGQPELKARLRATSDRQWEEARYNAWLRQLLSDDSSDENEDEERYGRFAESGRWMMELYGIPQHPTATTGGECSA
jgi:hypothetical protein